jgi:hypothetical protein
MRQRHPDVLQPPEATPLPVALLGLFGVTLFRFVQLAWVP